MLFTTFSAFPTIFKSLTSQTSQKRPTREVFVYKIQVTPIHTILKYGIYYDYGSVMLQFLEVLVNGNFKNFEN